jgi:hypothetical protein
MQKRLQRVVPFIIKYRDLSEYVLRKMIRGIASWLKAKGLRRKAKKIQNNMPCALSLMTFALGLFEEMVQRKVPPKMR